MYHDGYQLLVSVKEVMSMQILHLLSGPLNRVSDRYSAASNLKG